MSDRDDWLGTFLEDVREFVAGGGRIVFRTSEQWDELQRTRITPGADPREPWTSATEQREAANSLRPIFEAPNSDGKPIALLDGPFEEWGIRRARYVPVDVCRWRDPVHRKGMTERARAHAAIKPGVYR